MTKRIAAVKARQTLGTLLDDVKHSGAEYLIERDGKPTAAVIPLEAYQRCLASRVDAFDRVEELRSRLTERLSTSELEDLIEEAVREVRNRP